MAEESFPIEAVKHLAKCSCRCQHCAADVDENRHYDRCMVGKAQEWLGIKVTKKSLFSFKGAAE